MALHLAQLNVATLRHAINEPETADFFNALDPVNAAGEASPGFVWRLQADDGNATSISAFPNPLTIVGPSQHAFEFGQQFPEVATSLPY